MEQSMLEYARDLQFKIIPAFMKLTKILPTTTILSLGWTARTSCHYLSK
jgi:hypothetical protein